MRRGQGREGQVSRKEASRGTLDEEGKRDGEKEEKADQQVKGRGKQEDTIQQSSDRIY